MAGNRPLVCKFREMIFVFQSITVGHPEEDIRRHFWDDFYFSKPLVSREDIHENFEKK